MRVEALATRDAGDHGNIAAEGGKVRGAENAKGGRVPGGWDESAVFQFEDERLWSRIVFGGVVGDCDLPPLLLPVGMPGLGFFALPGLLKDCGAVGGELDQYDPMDLRRDATAAGVEALQLFRGVGDGRESYAKEEEENRMAWGGHGRHPIQRASG